MTKPDPKDPSQVSDEYMTMSHRWHLMRSVLGGTETMRAAGEDFLPRHMEESDVGYSERLDTAILLNMTELTSDTLVGKPFREPIKVGQLQEPISEYVDDIDLQGNNLDVFAFNWFKEGLEMGFSHVLVDFPRRSGDEDRTLEDDRRERLRPYWVRISPENLIYARSEMINGVEVLTHVRIKEMVRVPNGFVDDWVMQIRVLEPGLVSIYQEVQIKGKGKKWAIVDQYETSLDFIPLVTFYATRDGLMLSKPPLYDLAIMNVRWWQSNADQQSVLTVARFPIFAASGVEDEKGILRIGPRQIITTPDPAGKYYYVEHSGRAIESGRFELNDLEDRMASYGAQLLRRKPGNSTATARAIDNAENVSQLQRMTVSFIDAMETALWYTAKWIGLDDGGTLEMNKDFSGLNGKDSTELDAIFNARKLRDISRETYLDELKRRGILDEAYDSSKDAALLEDELMLLAPPSPDPDQSNEANEAQL